MEDKSYSNKEITVYWKPKLCSHSAICLNGLPNVFRTNEKPWININGASSEDIVRVVKLCPSGALTYSKLNEPATITEEKNSKEVIVNFVKDGPLIIKSDCKIIDANGNIFFKKNNCSLCLCGLSKEKPFCDGSHYQPREK